MPSALDVLRRLRRRGPPPPPITSLVGLTSAFRSVVVALGAATATHQAGWRERGIGVMDLDEYAVRWLARERLRGTRPQPAVQALLGSAHLPLHRRARVVVGRALIRAGHRVTGQITAATETPARSRESTEG